MKSKLCSSPARAASVEDYRPSALLDEKTMLPISYISIACPGQSKLIKTG